MIVDPDFLDHWRTRMVVDALGGDELAPTYILRLWAHCQTRKGDRFAIPTAGLKAQCRYTGDAVQFEQALTDAGFVQREGDTIHVLGWAEQNAALLAAWDNGSRGGRPKKEPGQNPRVSGAKPTGNPAVTHGEPSANPDETDKSRSDKNSPSDEGERTRASRSSPLPRPDDVTDQTWADWLQLRKSKRAPVTPTVLAGAREQAALAGLTLETFLGVWCRRGSQGLEAAWLRPEERGSPRQPFANKHSAAAAGIFGTPQRQEVIDV